MFGYAPLADRGPAPLLGSDRHGNVPSAISAGYTAAHRRLL